MYKLLNAGFNRLIKNKLFWGLILITICMACFFLKIRDDLGESIELLTMPHIATIGFFISIFTTLFVGLEYANGTIRNKIVVGHSRTKIYLSNLIISITVGIFIELVYILFISIIGKTIIDDLPLLMPVSQFITILLHIVMIIVMYSTIFNCITLLCNDITVSTIICIMFVVIMYIADIKLAIIANTEKYNYEITYNEKGEETKQIIGLNPNYPGETNQNIAKNIRNFMPVGQTNQIMEVVSEQTGQIIMNYKNEIPDTKHLFGYSLGNIIIINAMGIYVFNKKEIK